MKKQEKTKSVFKIGSFLTVVIAAVALLLQLSTRPNLVISVDSRNSNIGYVSTEIKNAGNAPAFDLKYNLFSEIKTTQGVMNVPNPQDPLFAKSIFPVGQLYQGGRITGVTSDMKIIELLLRYEITYQYSIINIPPLNQWWKQSSKV